MTYEEFLASKEATIEELAQQIAKTITIRTYHNGNSSDDARPTTKLESDIIYAVAIGCLHAIQWAGTDIKYAKGAVNAGESILRRFFPEANCYDTIYCPLMNVTGLWHVYI